MDRYEEFEPFPLFDEPLLRRVALLERTLLETVSHSRQLTDLVNNLSFQLRVSSERIHELETNQQYYEMVERTGTCE
jgi:hypothetical protein